MFRNSTLALVKQIHAVVESPDLLREHGCLEQVVTTLQTYLDSPDDCIQLSAARALVKLSARCDDQVWQGLDLSRARQVQAAAARDPAKNELEQFLTEALQRTSEVITPGRSPIAGANVKAIDYGELTLNVLGDVADVEKRKSFLRSVVELEGVVSATFEDGQLVIVTRSTVLSRDKSLLAEIRATLQDTFGGEVELSVTDGDEFILSAPYVDDDDDLVPEYLDDIDDFYEDDEDEGCFAPESLAHFESEAKLRTLKQRSMKMQQADEDPAIAARLTRAKRREDKQRAKEQARVDRILSVITPQRHIRS